MAWRQAHLGSGTAHHKQRHGELAAKITAGVCKMLQVAAKVQGVGTIVSWYLGMLQEGCDDKTQAATGS